MTCADVEPLRDAFVDAELPGPMLLAVARHAGTCGSCDEALRALGAVRETVARTLEGEADTLELKLLWPMVQRRIEGEAQRRTWLRRARVVPAWGAVAALAAGALFWLQTPAPTPRPEPGRVATRPRPNQAVIERLSAANNSRVSLRRERKNGTTLIMVRADAGEVGR